MYLFFIINIYYIYDYQVKGVEEMDKFEAAIDIVQIMAVIITTVGIIIVLWLMPIARWISLIWLSSSWLICMIVLMNVRAQLERKRRRKNKNK